MHLSRRLKCTIVITRCPSLSVRLSGVRPVLTFHIFNFPSETAEQNSRKKKDQIHKVINIGSEMNFHSIRYLWNELCVFYIPEPLARGYKTHNEFHKFRMEWKFISDSFYHMFNSQKRTKNTVLSSFITDFTVENVPTSGRYLWRHRLTATSKPIKMLPCAIS